MTTRAVGLADGAAEDLAAFMGGRIRKWWTYFATIYGWAVGESGCASTDDAVTGESLERGREDVNDIALRTIISAGRSARAAKTGLLMAAAEIGFPFFPTRKKI